MMSYCLRVLNMSLDLIINYLIFGKFYPWATIVVRKETP